MSNGALQAKLSTRGGYAYEEAKPKAKEWRFIGVSYNARTGDFVIWDGDKVGELMDQMGNLNKGAPYSDNTDGGSALYQCIYDHLEPEREVGL